MQFDFMTLFYVNKNSLLNLLQWVWFYSDQKEVKKIIELF